MSALRIAVGFKVTPDYEALRPADWARVAAAEAQARAEATRFVRRVLGVFDEAALELALRLRDARAERGLQTHLAAFSIGGREADPFLETLLALGYGRACRVEAGEDLDFAPATTARLVAACAERLGGDVLLLGAESGPGDSAVVPFLAAEALGRPCLTQVTEIDPLDDGRAARDVAGADGPLRATVAPPCVLAVGNALVSMLRVPTLRDRLAARDAEPRGADAARPGRGRAVGRSPPRSLGLERVERGRAGRVIPGASPEQKARALFEEELRPRLDAAVSAAADTTPPAAPAALRVAAVLDGGGDDADRAARALAGFLREGLRAAVAAEVTIAVHDDPAAADRLVAAAPTEEVRLLQVPPHRPDLTAAALTALRRRRRRRPLRVHCRPARDRGGGAPRRPHGRQRRDRGPRCRRGPGRADLPPARLLGPPHRPPDAAPAAVVPGPRCELGRRRCAAGRRASRRRALSTCPPPRRRRRRRSPTSRCSTPPATGDLESAAFVVVAGRGAGREGVQRIAAAAARMGAAFGATRPVVMNGWAPMDRLVGVSGTRTAPAVCVTAGVHGAPALLWGIERAGFIAGVDSDENAPIAAAADAVVVDDAVAIVEALADLRWRALRLTQAARLAIRPQDRGSSRIRTNPAQPRTASSAPSCNGI